MIGIIMVPKLVSDTLSILKSMQGTQKAGTIATALSVTGSIVKVGDKYSVFHPLGRKVLLRL